MQVTAVCRRSGGWWAIEVPEVEGVFTQTRRLDQVAEMVRDAIVTLRPDVDASSIDVEVQPELPPQLADEIQRARDAARRAERAQQEAAASSRDLVRDLAEQLGLTVRDIGAIIGISPQRVSQLRKGNKAA